MLISQNAEGVLVIERLRTLVLVHKDSCKHIVDAKK